MESRPGKRGPESQIWAPRKEKPWLTTSQVQCGAFQGLLSFRAIAHAGSRTTPTQASYHRWPGRRRRICRPQRELEPCEGPGLVDLVRYVKRRKLENEGKDGAYYTCYVEPSLRSTFCPPVRRLSAEICQKAVSRVSGELAQEDQVIGAGWNLADRPTAPCASAAPGSAV